MKKRWLAIMLAILVITAGSICFLQKNPAIEPTKEAAEIVFTPTPSPSRTVTVTRTSRPPIPSTITLTPTPTFTPTATRVLKTPVTWIYFYIVNLENKIYCRISVREISSSKEEEIFKGALFKGSFVKVSLPKGVYDFSFENCKGKVTTTLKSILVDQNRIAIYP
jgi:hypothetical protein